VKEKRNRAKDGPDADPMKEMRDRYDRAVEAEIENRRLAISDFKFVAVPGNQWDDAQKKARKNRPCYEIPILRSNWRQVVNDQKKARPGIKVRPVENGDAKGAELRQGLLRNIESRSNAERAYDSAFELLTATGFGAWRVKTAYSTEDAWDQDLVIESIVDPLNSVWVDPDAKSPDSRDAMFGFIEDTMSREAFKDKYPDADCVSFESSAQRGMGAWFSDKNVRVVEYLRKKPIKKTLVLLSDGRSIDANEITAELAAQLQQQGITVKKQREFDTYKVVSSICSGVEEIDGPHDVVFDRLPIITVYANRHFIEGKWYWCGMTRPARDPQKLANYNITTGQEALAKQHKALPIVTAKMLEGDGVKKMWDASNSVDIPYLPITPDHAMPGGPYFLQPPSVHASFVQMGQMSIDMVKMATGIYDASLGARSNETSGKAITARQNEGDTATFDYQDALNFGIQSTGEILLPAFPKVYDTQRAMRVLGKDGSEKMVNLYEEAPDGSKANDLSIGKYDVSISVGPNYDTMRMEFVDALTQLGQGNPMVQQATADLVMKASDFPGADEAAERLKMLLPPQIQQMLNSEDESPAVMQLKAQIQQMEQQAQEHMQAIQQEVSQLQAKAQSKDDAILREINADKDRELAWFEAETNRIAVLQKSSATNDANAIKAAGLEHQVHEGEASRQHDMTMAQANAEQSQSAQAAEQAHQQVMAAQTTPTE